MAAFAKDTGSASEASLPNDPFGMAAWLKGTAGLSMHPMMAQTTAMAVAATAIGMSVSSQLAGSFFGALQGASETMRKSAAEATPEQAVAPAAVVEKVAETVVAGAVVVADVVETPVMEAKPKPVEKVAARAKLASKAKLSIVATPAPVSVTDLKRIDGIGPKLEQVLNGMGVASLVDIAGWEEAKAAEVDQALGFDGRILKDDWIGQAKALIAK